MISSCVDPPLGRSALNPQKWFDITSDQSTSTSDAGFIILMACQDTVCSTAVQCSVSAHFDDIWIKVNCSLLWWPRTYNKLYFRLLLEAKIVFFPLHQCSKIVIWHLVGIVGLSRSECEWNKNTLKIFGLLKNQNSIMSKKST